MTRRITVTAEVPRGEARTAPQPLRILIIDESHERARMIEQGLVNIGEHVIESFSAPQDIHARVRVMRPDVIIIDMNSPTRDVLEDMAWISRDCPRPIVMFTNDGDPDTIRSAVRAGVSAYVFDGLTSARVAPVVEAARVRFEAFQRLRHERDAAVSSLEERKLVERAKGIVMRRLSLSEDQAYHRLRKLAMDRHVRLSELAKSVIDAELVTNDALDEPE